MSHFDLPVPIQPSLHRDRLPIWYSRTIEHHTRGNRRVNSAPTGEWIIAALRGSIEPDADSYNLARLLESLHQVNKQQRKLEDACRQEIGLEAIGSTKLAIDRSNARRVALMCRIDERCKALAPSPGRKAPVFPATFGGLIDQASVAEIRRDLAGDSGTIETPDSVTPKAYSELLLEAIELLLAQLWEGSVRLIDTAPNKTYS